MTRPSILFLAIVFPVLPQLAIAQDKAKAKPRILQAKTWTWKGSQDNYAKYSDLVFEVGMGGHPDGVGYGDAAIEIDKVRVVTLSVDTSPSFTRFDDNSFAGFFVDYHTEDGYKKRVALSIGMYSEKRWAKTPVYGKVTTPDRFVDLGKKKSYDLDLTKWAPEGWDGRVWFVVALQNTGKDTSLRAVMEFSESIVAQRPKEDHPKQETPGTKEEEKDVKTSKDINTTLDGKGNPAPSPMALLTKQQDIICFFHQKEAPLGTVKLVNNPQNAIALLPGGVRRHLYLISLSSEEVEYKDTVKSSTVHRSVARKSRFLAIQTAQGTVYAYNHNANGFYECSRRIYLLSLTSDELQFKENATALSVQRCFAKDKHILTMQTATGGVYAYNPSADQFVRVLPPGIAQVTSEGIGGSASEALKDAFRNAIRHAVGALVDAETVIKNDEIISDKVLTYSHGFVEGYDELSKTEDKGVVRIKIVATVKRRELISKLRATNIAVNDIDGKGMFAEIVTQLEAEKKARQMVAKALEGFPLNVLEARVVGQPTVLKRSESGVTLSVRVWVQANLVNYNAFGTNLFHTLDQIAMHKSAFVVEASREKDGSLRLPGSWWKNKINRPDDAKGIIAINIPFLTINFGAGERTAYNCYVLDGSVRASAAEACGRAPTLTVQLRDKDDKVIAHESSRLGTPMFIHPFRGRFDKGKLSVNEFGSGLFLIWPFFVSNVHPFRYSPKMEIDRVISISLDDLQSLRKVTCELTEGR